MYNGFGVAKLLVDVSVKNEFSVFDAFISIKESAPKFNVFETTLLISMSHL